jgi:hypothetical protein
MSDAPTIPGKLPSEQGKRRYPPDGVYTNGMVRVAYWTVCTCAASCPTPCRGDCGCGACALAAI